ncbi:LysR substrate-binding domain-containing protein [Geminicoccaceae bacterium 1502E]|nr:LysR substrate-binding domain-containing protein [Geminicoccaceae bacterium 1502E]
MPQLIEPELLRSFIAIAEAGSFTEAALRVHRTQSAVSMQMKRLEDMVGRRLFEKAGRGVSLSRDGERLLAHARRVLRAHHEALAAFDRDALDGRVTLAAPDDYASTFLPRILARFSASHPRVEVEMVCESSQGLVRKVGAGEVDLALVTEGCGETSGTVVHREQLVWAASAAHDVHECDPLPLALFHPGCAFRKAALERLAAVGRTSRIAYTSLSIAGLHAALAAGLAVAVLARSSVREGMRILDERHGLPALPDFGIVMIRRPGAPSALLDALETHIKESFRIPPPIAA